MTIRSLPIVVLLALGTLVYLPVLVWPHWGFFSDATQIIQNCQVFWREPWQNLALIQGYWRPGFHIIDLLTWQVSPNNPLGFYAVRWLCFLGTLLCTYLSSLLLSRSRLFSFLFSLLWFFAAPTYEVIYTLDKGETYIALLFAVALWGYLNYADLIEKSAGVRGFHLGFAAIVFSSMLYAMFTKETAQLFIVAGVLLPGALLLRGACRQKSSIGGSQSEQRKGLRLILAEHVDPTLAWALVFLASATVSLLIYKAYFYWTGGASGQYIQLHLHGRFLIKQVVDYIPVLPDLCELICFGLLSGAAATIADLIGERRIEPQTETPEMQAQVSGRRRQLTALALVFTALVGTIPLLGCWPGQIAYFWFPLYSLLLPAACYYGSRWFELLGARFGPAKFLLPAGLVAAMLTTIQLRTLQAECQFQQDALVNDLGAKLATYIQQNHLQAVAIALPFNGEAFAEIGERIKFFTLNQLVPNYVPSAPSTYPKVSVRFINFLSYTQPGSNGGAPVPMQGPGIPVEALREPGSDPNHVGLNAWSYTSDSGSGPHWAYSDLHPGALLLVPYGDIPKNKIPYRGSDLFPGEWRAKVRWLPQIRFRELFRVSRSLPRGLNQHKTIGWSLLAVESVPALSWSIEPDGWLSANWIDCARALNGKTLRLEDGFIMPVLVNVSYANGDVRQIKSGREGNTKVLDVPLACPQSPNSKTASFLIKLSPPQAQSEVSRFIHVNRASVR